MAERSQRGVLKPQEHRASLNRPLLFPYVCTCYFEGEITTLQLTAPDSRWQWLLQAAASLWNEAHPEATVSLSCTTVPLAELHDHLSLAVARGQAPEISTPDSV